MKLAVETSQVSKHIGNYFFSILFPKIKLGYIHGKYEEEKWVGISVSLDFDLNYEAYDYGWIFKFAFFGFGIIINKINFYNE